MFKNIYFRWGAPGLSVDLVKEHYEKEYATRHDFIQYPVVKAANLLRPIIPKELLDQHPIALDVACGVGVWTEALRSLGCKAHGVDLTVNAVTVSRQYFPECSFEQSDIFEYKGNFDIVFTRSPSFLNGPILEDGKVSEVKIQIVKHLLSLGKTGGLLIIVMAYADPSKAGWAAFNPPMLGWYTHTPEEFEKLLSIFGKPEVTFQPEWEKSVVTHMTIP